MEKILTIVKRDGRKVAFDRKKIENAIGKAYNAERGSDAPGFCASAADSVYRRITAIGKDEIGVEEIQDIVEDVLMESSCKDVARAYIRYREKRTIARKAPTNEIFRQIIDAQANDITRENANMNADTPAGMMMKFASESAKTFVDENLLSSPEVIDSVRGNYIHIHDKDYYPTKSLTCIQHPTDKFLRDGFVDGHASVRPARRIETAATVACITLEAVQNKLCSLL